MKTCFIFLLLFLLPGRMVYAQSVNPDSLLRLIQQSPEDTGKLSLYLKLADHYERNNQDSCALFTNMARTLAAKLHDKAGLFRCYEQALILSYTKGEYELALKQCDTAISLAKELRDSGMIVRILGNMGIIYQYTGRFDQQLEYSLETLAILERMNATERIANMYHNIANAYFNLNQNRKCLDYCRLALDYYHRYGGRMSLNRLYASFGNAYQNLQVNDSALYYYKMAATESARINDLYAEGSIYGYMTNLYAALRNFDRMYQVAEKSLAIARNLQSSQMLASSLYNMAYASYFNHKDEQAKAYVQEALGIALRDSLLDELKNTYTVLSYIAANEGDYPTSYGSLMKSDSIKAIMNNDAVLKATAELEKKYETEKKEATIQWQKTQLENRQRLNYILGALALLLVVISFLLYRTYRQKQKLQQRRISELETEKKLSATEAVLKGEEQERARLAKDLHDGLSGMLSGVKYSLQDMKGNLIMTEENQQAFERSIDMLDSSIQEMRRVAHNMMPEVLVRYGLDAALKDYVGEINKSAVIKVVYQSMGMEQRQMDRSSAIAVYRIVQELLNNVIKHAEASEALVQVIGENGKLLVNVEDNGRGFDSRLSEEQGGMGWRNIRSRVDLLHGKVDVQSAPGSGTAVNLEFNLA